MNLPSLTIFTVAFVLVFPFGARAEKPHHTTEGPRDLVEKAHNLTLQHDRSQAVSILVTAIKREPPGSSSGKEMRATLQEISDAFLGDKTQQLYELSLSFRKSDLGQAQGRLSEALRLEPDNLRLLNEQARLQIARSDCGAAAEALAKHRRWNPFDEETLLTSAQAAVCQADWPAYTSLRSQAEGRKGPLARYWLTLEVERAQKEVAESRLKEALEQLKKENRENPETNYWQWKTTAAKDGGSRLEAAQRYLMACKNLSAAQFRKFMFEPLLCRHVTEVESSVKGVL